MIKRILVLDSRMQFGLGGRISSTGLQNAVQLDMMDGPNSNKKHLLHLGNRCFFGIRLMVSVELRQLQEAKALAFY